MSGGTPSSPYASIRKRPSADAQDIGTNLAAKQAMLTPIKARIESLSQELRSKDLLGDDDDNRDASDEGSVTLDDSKNEDDPQKQEYKLGMLRKKVSQLLTIKSQALEGISTQLVEEIEFTSTAWMQEREELLDFVGEMMLTEDAYLERIGELENQVEESVSVLEQVHADWVADHAAMEAQLKTLRAERASDKLQWEEERQALLARIALLESARSVSPTIVSQTVPIFVIGPL